MKFRTCFANFNKETQTLMKLQKSKETQSHLFNLTIKEILIHECNPTIGLIRNRKTLTLQASPVPNSGRITNLASSKILTKILECHNNNRFMHQSKNREIRPISPTTPG